MKAWPENPKPESKKEERMTRYHREWAEWWETDRRRYTEPKRPGRFNGSGDDFILWWGLLWLVILPIFAVVTGIRIGL